MFESLKFWKKKENAPTLYIDNSCGCGGNGDSCDDSHSCDSSNCSSCGCGSSCGEPATPTRREDIWVKVLGTGCAKCNELQQTTKDAIASLGLDLQVEHITDVQRIARYCVISTPALVLGDTVVSMGKTLTKQEVIDFIKSEQGRQQA